jgi:hypothetical protein
MNSGGTQTVNLDNTLWLASFVTEATVVGLLTYRRVWRTLPVFFVYCTWLVLVDAIAYPVLRFFPAHYFTVYLATTVVYSALELGVLVELTWSVLRPVGALLPRKTLLVVIAIVLALGTAIWPFAVIPGFGNFPPQWHLLMRFEQTTSILRIVFCLLLAGCSQLLSIGWRDRELQIASGLGFYSLVGIGVAMLHTHLTTQSQYRYLNQVEVAGYLCSLMYWAFSFAAKEAERREFTPQMQSFLLALAGTARTTRVNFADSPPRKPRGR